MRARREQREARRPSRPVLHGLRAPIAATALAWASAARAGPPPIHHDLRIDGAVTAGATALWLGTELGKRSLAPSACRWCAENRLDGAVRERLVWGDTERAHLLSNVGVAVLPAALVAHQVLGARADGDAKEGWVDALVVAQAAALSLDLNQLVKFAAGRQRPFVHNGNFREAGRAPDPDDNLSFYSGHSALAFSLAAAAGTVSDLRGYRSAPWVWGAGMTAATGIAYLRIAADRHYLTDVLTGAALGTAAGIALPRLLHGRRGGGEARATAPFGIVVAF